MLLVDDFSRKTWVCFLSRKSDALSNFQVWLAQVENQSRAKVSFLRTDNGREFLPFDDFLASKGIQRQTTIPYTPSQNGVVERKNRTVKEMARSLLQHAKLPPAFWGEAIATSVYILNRSLTKAVDGKTPEEVFSRRKPNVSHFRVFGCVAHVHVPASKRTTLAAKSTQMIFTGYALRSKGFRFWDPSIGDIVLSRDVCFDE